MNLSRVMLAVAVVVGLLAATPAEAARRARASRASPSRTALGLGADYLLDPERGAFLLTLAVETPLARSVTLGGRFGAMLLADPGEVGVPIDLRLRGRFGRVYLDGLVGPWIVFDDGDAVRFHAGVGFGLLGRGFSFGLEVGYLDPTATIGVRLAFPL